MGTEKGDTGQRMSGNFSVFDITAIVRIGDRGFARGCLLHPELDDLDFVSLRTIGMKSSYIKCEHAASRVHIALLYFWKSVLTTMKHGRRETD